LLERLNADARRLVTVAESPDTIRNDEQLANRGEREYGRGILVRRLFASERRVITAAEPPQTLTDLRVEPYPG
jgi:hypothetical protein